MDKFYWLGFEDGFADRLANTIHLSSLESYHYMNGWRAGRKARIMEKSGLHG